MSALLDSPVARILARLRDPKPAGAGKYTARCPAHDDRHASLSVGTGDGHRALLHCHSGCGVEEIVGAIGLTLADLYDENRNGQAEANGHRHATPVTDLPDIDWRARAADYAQALTPELRRELAQAIHIPESAIATLCIGWNQSEAYWTWPEEDGSAKVIGINRRYRTGKKKAMPGARRGLTVPKGWREHPGAIYLTEGGSDALALTAMGRAAIGRPNATLGVEHLGELLRDVPAGREIIVIGDNDPKPGRSYSNAGYPGLTGCVQTARKLADALNRPIRVAMTPDGRKDVRRFTSDRAIPIEGEACVDDWVETGDTFDALLKLHTITPASPTGQADTHQHRADDLDESNSTERARITISPDEHHVIAHVTAELAARDHELYQRGGELVRIGRVARPRTKRLQHSGAPHIERMPNPDLRTRITRHCLLLQERGEKVVAVSPPFWLPDGVAAQATPWNSIRPLEAVTETPLLRPDGTILQESGYDPSTGILFEPSMVFEPVPAEPTKEDAIAARDALLRVVADFPFATEAHKAAWLASVLTPFARPAYDGPTPLFLTDANIRGCGKGLSASCASIIATGRPFATAIYSHDPIEMQKTITAIALAGEPLIMLDNLAGPFGNGSLDAALTSTDWQGRRLGKSEQPRVPLTCVWYATGNNCIIAADTARRICHIRLESPEERPEERSGFQHADLLAWVRAERPRLLRAALTILAAYCRAGRPQTNLKPWGSFEGWSALVRQAIIWINLPDPADTRVALADDCDTDVSTLRALIAVWRAIVPEGKLRTAADVLATIKSQPVERLLQHETLISICPDKSGGLPTPKQLGNLLRRYRGRVCDGVSFVAELDAHTKTLAWGLK
jgi:hypothetical protein